MAKLIKARKAVVTLEGVELSEKGVIVHPRFYIKQVCGRFSLYHRLTHSYMGVYAGEGELAEALEEFKAMSEEDLWDKLITTRGFSLTGVTGAMREKYFEHDEDWYLGAWGVYTTAFYSKHPELLQEVKQVPMDIVNRVRNKHSERLKAEHKKHREEIERIENEYRERPSKREGEPRVQEPEEAPRVEAPKKPILKKPVKLPPIREEQPQPGKPKIKKKILKLPTLNI